jgi:Carboxypeptidase regulatory-like domain
LSSNPGLHTENGAKVRAINQTNQARVEETTNTVGNYVFLSLQPGLHTVSVEASGFSDDER